MTLWLITGVFACLAAYLAYLDRRERREDEDERAMHASIED